MVVENAKPRTRLARGINKHVSSRLVALSFIIHAMEWSQKGCVKSVLGYAYVVWGMGIKTWIYIGQ